MVFLLDLLYNHVLAHLIDLCGGRFIFLSWSMEKDWNRDFVVVRSYTLEAIILLLLLRSEHDSEGLDRTRLVLLNTSVMASENAAIPRTRQCNCLALEVRDSLTP